MTFNYLFGRILPSLFALNAGRFSGTYPHTFYEESKEYTKNYAAKSARIKFDKPRMLQLDGEVIGACESIEAEIIPGGARFITTRDNHFIDQLKRS